MSFFQRYRIIIFLTGIAAFLHFYNLNWGAPFYFHPDERNIAAAVSQLQFPTQMNPHFFAYGSLPIYIVYFTGVLINIFSNLPALLHPLTDHFSPQHVSFEQAIISMRFYSALFSTLLIPLLFFLGKKLKDETTGLFAAFFATMSVGLIQFAHFGTFELWLTFFTTLLFALCLRLPKHATTSSLLLLGVVSGILASIKISHLAIIPLALLVIIIQELYQNPPRHHIYKIARIIRGTLLFFGVVIAVYCVTNPYVLLTPNAFQGSMQYESGVALGTLSVFYTGEFFRSIPLLFQLQYVYPFLINPLITLLFFPSFAYFIYRIIKTKSFMLLLLTAFFLLLLCSQAFLFVKWTRYMVPTLPFIYLMTAFGVSSVLALMKRNLIVKYLTIIVIIITCTTFGLAYTITAFIQPDTRIVAANFANKTIPHDARIISEVYDLGITPFNGLFPNLQLINFYEMDTGNLQPDAVRSFVDESEYLILPSQRLLKVRLMNQKNFPNGYAFYRDLVTGNLGYTKIYETPCDIFCKIAYLGNPVYQSEETANVFDRPTVYIFKKDTLH